MIGPNRKDMEKMAAEMFGEKFTLVCSIHKRGYGSKKPPVFKCKECAMVQLVGLMCNIPPDRRMEVMEMLEYSTNKLCEAESRGELDIRGLLKHPEVTIGKE